MGWLTFIERNLGRLLESCWRPKREGTISPLRISRELVRAMEAGRRRGVNRIYVPNYYRVFLSPADYAELAPLAPLLIEETEGVLSSYQEKAGYTLAGPLLVSFQERKEVPAGQVSIKGDFYRPAPSREGARADTPPKTAATSGAANSQTATRVLKPDFIPQVLFPSAPSQEGVTLEEGEKGEAPTRRWHAQDFRKGGREEEGGGGNWATGPQPNPIAVLRVVAGPDAGAVFPLRAGEELSIGRQGEILLADPQVSRRHAVIRCQEGAIFLQDLNSRNGSFLNGRRIQEKELRDGDLLQLGETVLLFQVEAGKGGGGG